MSTTNVIPLSQNKDSCFICGDTTDFHIHKCLGCGKYHCIQHASKADIQYCEQCVVDVTVTEETFQRVEETYDEEKDIVTKTTTGPSKKISFSGADWTFINNAIRTLSDEELKLHIQIYRAAVSSMEAELTQRKIKHMVVARINGQVVSRKTTEVKTVKHSKATKQLDLTQIAEQMKKMNLTPEQIKQILGL